MLVVNLYALRATDPRELRQAADPVGPQNDGYINRAMQLAPVGSEVAGWGVHGGLRGAEIADRFPQLKVLGLTKDGHPRHPLYMPRSAQPALWVTPS